VGRKHEEVNDRARGENERRIRAEQSPREDIQSLEAEQLGGKKGAKKRMLQEIGSQTGASKRIINVALGELKAKPVKAITGKRSWIFTSLQPLQRKEESSSLEPKLAEKKPIGIGERAKLKRMSDCSGLEKVQRASERAHLATCFRVCLGKNWEKKAKTDQRGENTQAHARGSLRLPTNHRLAS